VTAVATLYVAASKTLAEWASDVGLGRHVFRVGVADEAPDAIADALNATVVAGQSDWTILAHAPTTLAEDEAVARLAAKEKMVDPTYYPRIRGDRAVVKVTAANVANHLLVRAALDGREIALPKPKAKDFGLYLMRNIQG
jgi:hypothetical protein